MSLPNTRVLTPPPGFESVEAALYIAQLEDLTTRLRKDLDGVTPQQLEWQAAPGMNTVGMLLAHNAIAEVYWASTLTEQAFLCEQVLGLGADDDGMPCAEGAPPPAGLAGKALPYFFDLLLKAREYTRTHVAPLTIDDLTRTIEVRRQSGAVTLNGHWMLYHMVEHFGGHYAQINLLLHLQRMIGVQPPQTATSAPR